MKIKVEDTRAGDTSLMKRMMQDLKATGKYHIDTVEVGYHHVTWEIHEIPPKMVELTNQLQKLSDEIERVKEKIKNPK